jgi:hypothetical protein
MSMSALLAGYSPAVPESQDRSSLLPKPFRFPHEISDSSLTTEVPTSNGVPDHFSEWNNEVPQGDKSTDHLLKRTPKPHEPDPQVFSPADYIEYFELIRAVSPNRNRMLQSPFYRNARSEHHEVARPSFETENRFANEAMNADSEPSIHESGAGDSAIAATLRFVVVSGFLFLILAGLLSVRSLKEIGAKIKIKSIRIRLPYRFWVIKRHLAMASIRHDSGFSYVCEVKRRIPCDAKSRSRVMVYEDGAPLQAPHTPHDLIRMEGAGRFSHWDGHIFFSTSDNSDPRTNGRTYTFMEI